MLIFLNSMAVFAINFHGRVASKSINFETDINFGSKLILKAIYCLFALQVAYFGVFLQEKLV